MLILCDNSDNACYSLRDAILDRLDDLEPCVRSAAVIAILKFVREADVDVDEASEQKSLVAVLTSLSSDPSS